MDRSEAIKRIKRALRERSGKPWSVTGGRGTAWGWIRIDAPPARRVCTCDPANRFFAQFHDGSRSGCTGHATDADRAELGALLGFDAPVHQQGVSIPASTDYYTEHVDRAEGRTPSVIGRPYWD